MLERSLGFLHGNLQDKAATMPRRGAGSSVPNTGWSLGFAPSPRRVLRKKGKKQCATDLFLNPS